MTTSGSDIAGRVAGDRDAAEPGATASGTAAVPAQPGAPAVEVEAADMATGEPAAGARTLTDRERQILAFERKWWRHAGAKEQAIRDTFELSATRYYQILNGLLDDPAALAYDPVVVGRLHRLRASRGRTGRSG